jgi:hypothetical protein
LRILEVALKEQLAFRPGCAITRSEIEWQFPERPDFPQNFAGKAQADSPVLPFIKW